MARTYAYDGIGSIYSDGVHSYGYDDRGRMTNLDNGAVQYAINGFGQRVRKLGGALAGDANGDLNYTAADVTATVSQILGISTAAGPADCNNDVAVDVRDIACINNYITVPPASKVTLHYAYDENGQQLGEYNASGGAIQETIWFGGMPVAVMKGGVLYYIYTDHLNTPRAITDNTNKVLWTWQGEPFGNVLPNEDVDANSVKFTYNLRFAGQYYDAESGLHYNYHRDYDPKTGRYLESDPIGLKGGLNTYAYGAGDPLSTIDYFGLDPTPHVLKDPKSYIYETKYVDPDGKHECVMFAQQAGGAPKQAKKTWFFGGKPNKDTPEGTWIATPGPDGHFKGHVGAFLSMDKKGSIKMVDQFARQKQVLENEYQDRPDSEHTYISNDASNYRILLWESK